MKKFNFKEKSVYIVAEIGVNHEGNLKKAEEMIKLAKESGVDAVKFQTFKAEKYVSINQMERFRRVKKFELTYNNFSHLAKFAKKLGIRFFSTPLHFDDIDFLKTITPIIKISSGDLTHLELIKYAAKKFEQIIISTGLGTKKEIKDSVETVQSVRPNILKERNLILMHCVSAYPTADEEANLNNILWLKKKFRLPVGYSDHTKGIKACELSVPLGVNLIEKHFTYSRKNQSFHDHLLSAEPDEMKKLVKNVRKAEIILGSEVRAKNKSEILNFANMRRSFCASKNLKKGKKINKDDLILLRPAQGFKPSEIKSLLDKTLKTNIKKGTIVEKKDIE